eukprot:scaffold21431_cov101-Isochrysis_galbana.AAC.1
MHIASCEPWLRVARVAPRAAPCSRLPCILAVSSSLTLPWAPHRSPSPRHRPVSSSPASPPCESSIAHGVLRPHAACRATARANSGRSVS